MEKWDDILKSDIKFRYQLLDRLIGDCVYYLGFGNRHKKYLWSQSEEEQIEIMKLLWSSFSDADKPEWTTLDEINSYEKQILANM